jgi:peptidoglycan/LPS O-acetylase OafA/YrhL
VKDRFGELDALRGFAALGVVFCHYSWCLYGIGVVDWTFNLGDLGPTLFFIVSGFVIFWTLERSRTLTDFLVSRFSRLYPTYWAAIAIWALIGYVIGDFWLRKVVLNATMLQSFIGMGDLDVVFWTLAIELAFYFWMAVIFQAGLLKDIVPVLLVWLALAAAVNWAPIGHVLTIPQIPNKSAGIVFVFAQIPYFAAGIMFYKARSEGWKLKYIAVLAAAFGVICMGSVRNVIFAAVAFPVFALAIANRLRFIVNPITVWLGTISYALYVTHNNAGVVLIRHLVSDQKISPWVAVTIATVGALILASAVTYTIERPALKVIRGVYSKWIEKTSRHLPQPRHV